MTIVRLVENFFNLDLVAKIKSHTRSIKKIRSNITDWEQVIVGGSGSILIWDIVDELYEEIKQEVVRQIPESSEFLTKEWGISGHVGSRLSYIPWHNDNPHKISITVYLNDNWTREHAGYLIYEDDNGLHAILPKYNLAVVFFPPIMHTVALPNIFAPLRESLQIFMND
jgi:hypothetical protein